MIAGDADACRRRSSRSWRTRSGSSGSPAKYANAKDIFFIGRGIDYAISLEGSLKMKEISYIHSRGLRGGRVEARHHQPD